MYDILGSFNEQRHFLYSSLRFDKYKYNLCIYLESLWKKKTNFFDIDKYNSVLYHTYKNFLCWKLLGKAKQGKVK